MDMRTYVGRRAGICEVWVEEEDGRRRDLPLNLHIRNHSPTGHEWGYGGSGPAQLALDILLDHFTKHDPHTLPYTNKEKALALYQDFKFAVIAKLPQEEWRLTTAQVNAALAKIKEKQDPF